MSNRPDWCPADVWEVAFEIYDPAAWDIARAILDERERCRTAIQKAYDEANSGEHPFSARECRTSYAISTAMAEIDR